MPIFRGTNQISKIFRGDTEIVKAFRGNDLIFQLGNNEYELLADVNVTANTFQVDFTGLNITKADELRLVYTLVGRITSITTYRLFVNGNTTNNNYNWQQLVGIGSMISAVRANENIVSVASSVQKTSGLVDIKVSNNDRYVYQSKLIVNTGSSSSSITNTNYNVVGNFTVSSITSLSFVATQPTNIATGSRFQLYKVVK